MSGKHLLGGRYRPIKQLSTSDRGGIYLVEDNQVQGSPRRIVRQLKLDSSSPRVIKFTASRLRQKIQTLRQLSRCRHLPTLFDCVETADSLYLVEEFVIGPALAQWFTKAPLPERAVIDITHELLLGLVVIHRWGFVHGNLSATTVVQRAADGTLVLCGFEGWYTRQQQATPQRQEPIGANAPPKPHFSEDVYAVGLLALQGLTALTAREIHERSTPLKSDQLLPLAGPPPSPQLMAVLQGMVSGPEHRYPTAAAALEDLRRVKAMTSAPRARPSPASMAFKLTRWRPSAPWLWGAVAVLGVCLPIALGRLPQQWLSRYFLHQAQTHPQGDPQQIVASASQALRYDPNNGEAYLQRGMAHIQLENWAAAQTDLTQAIARSDGIGQAFYYRGIARKALGELQGALQDYTQALDLDVNRARAYLERGEVRAALGDDPGAIADYTLALGHQPDLAMAYSNRCLAYLRERKPESALADCSRAIDLNPSNPSAYRHRSLVHQRLGNLEAAIADITLVIRLDPQNAEAYYQRGLLRLQTGDTAGALADFSQAVTLQPSHQRARRQRDDLQQRINRALQ